MASNIAGSDKVALYLSKYNDCFVIIGGIATILVLDNLGAKTRVTKDFDIVVIADGTNDNFSKAIFKFLKDGKYKRGKKEGREIHYRFIRPEVNGFPKIIELFSKEGNNIHSHLRKIDYIEDDEQLSVITIDSAVFEFVKNRKTIINDLPIVDEYGLVPLKVHAYFNNLSLFKEGKITNRNYYEKHLDDVIRLLAAISNVDVEIEMPEILKKNCIDFIGLLQKVDNRIKELQIGEITADQIVERFVNVFCK